MKGEPNLGVFALAGYYNLSERQRVLSHVGACAYPIVCAGAYKILEFVRITAIVRMCSQRSSRKISHKIEPFLYNAYAYIYIIIRTYTIVLAKNISQTKVGYYSFLIKTVQSDVTLLRFKKEKYI